MTPQEDDLPQDEPNYTDPPEDAAPPDRPESSDGDESGEPDGWAADAATPPPALASGPSIGGILQGLKRRWWVALGIGLVLAAGAAVAAWILLEPPYNAFAQIHIATTPHGILNPEIDLPKHRNEFAAYQKLQAAHIRGRRVLNAALIRPEIKSLEIVKQQADPLLWLEEQIRTEYQEGNEVMTIAMTGMDAEACRQIVNGVRESYFKEVAEVEQELRKDRMKQLEQIVTDEESALRRKKDDYLGMAKTLGTSDSGVLSFKQQTMLKTLMEKSHELTRTQWDLKLAEAKLKPVLDHLSNMAPQNPPGSPMPEPMQEMEPETLSESALTEIVARDQQVRELAARLKGLEQYLARCEKHLHEGDPGLINARKDVREAKATLDQRKAEVRVGVIEAAKEEQAKAKNTKPSGAIPGTAGNGQALTLEQAKAEVEALDKHAKELQSDVDKLMEESERFTLRSTALERLDADIKGDTKRLDGYKDELAKLRIELKPSVLPRVTRFQEAGLQKRDTKRQWMGAIVVPVVVLIAVCFAVGWWESRARRIHSADEVARGLGVRVVGAVPAFPRWGRKNEEAFEHILTESIDGIRTMLLREADRSPMQVVMVTSAVSGEGKTTLASQLAGSLARAGRRTLLIDADLRRPAAHQLFELPLQPGLSEVLLDEVHIAEATLSTEIDGLWMVPAGHWDRHVIQNLAKGGLGKAFERLREAYDFIVIDSHPVLPATDSQLIGQHADAVILAVMREVSQSPKVYAAFQRLASLHIRVLGAVVSGLPEQAVFSGGCSAAVPALR